MIKDKITPLLKDAFAESIKQAEEINREIGFFLCLKDGKLSESKNKCEGTRCYIVTMLSSQICPGKIQGFFHVHPDKLSAEMEIGRKIKKGEVVIIRDNKTGKIISPTIPSHIDVLTSLSGKCNELTEGTICTANDLEPNKVECWTPKKYGANLLTCNRVKKELNEDLNIQPKNWIKPLFDKEIIDI